MMDTIKDFLRSDRTGQWWGVAIWWLLFFGGSLVAIPVFVLAELDSTVLSSSSEAKIGIYAFFALDAGLIMGCIEYLGWEQQRRLRHLHPSQREG